MQSNNKGITYSNTHISDNNKYCFGCAEHYANKSNNNKHIYHESSREMHTNQYPNKCYENAGNASEPGQYCHSLSRIKLMQQHREHNYVMEQGNHVDAYQNQPRITDNDKSHAGAKLKLQPQQRKPERRATNLYYKQQYDREMDWQSQQQEKTWDFILSGRANKNPSIDQHYEHYFSYFYNRNLDNYDYKTYSSKNIRQRLPLNIPTSPSNIMNKNECRSKIRKNSELHQSNVPISLEKSTNNNVINGYDNGEWLPNFADTNLLKSNDNFNDGYGNGYDNETNRDKLKHLFNVHEEADTKKELLNLAKYDCGDSFSNDHKFVKRSVKSKENLIHSRLALTPKRVEGGVVPKKIGPSIHRVLLYNSQSPRMSRKYRQQDAKHLYRLPEAEVHKVILVKPQKNQIKGEGTSLRSDDNDEFEDDEDLDDVSNFGNSESDSNDTSDSEESYRAYAYKLTHSMERLPTLALGTSSDRSEENLKTPDSVLAPSLFPNVAPYLSFSSNTHKGPNVPPELHRILKWRVTNIMPKVVRLILANSGMRLLKKTNDWMGVWGKHLKSPCFKTIRSYQKINHLPGSFRIGRKDSCWKNLQRQMNKHSKKEFGFMPKTYIIPHDLSLLRKHWPKYAQRNTKWIIKPPASARGTGIRVVNRWAQIPKRKPLIVQKYIERPLLINGSKFDLRLYVLVTSINPLRVFMYHNGLARFASVKYSAKIDTLNDRCMHLTNYSINKFSSNYSKNEDVNACHGHKWTIKSLWTYLANRGVRTDYLWEALRSLVLRTILAGENSINNMIKMNVESKYSVFELFGFDVILDADLVPWLLEVNISPSLHSELPLDAHVKAPLVQGVLNTALYHVPPKLNVEKQRELSAEFCLPPDTPLCYDKRMYVNYLSREEKIKHNTFTRKSMEDRDDYLDAILNKLTPDDVRCLIIAEDEFARSAPLERIFPTDQTYKYLKYTDTPRYYNRLLDAWETRYANNRSDGITILRKYCQEKYHLQVPAPPAKKIIKFRPRTLVVTRPNVLTPSTLPWKLKWRTHKAMSQTSINCSVDKINKFITTTEGSANEDDST